MSFAQCLTRFHLIILVSLVTISLTLIIVGGSLSAWCIHAGSFRYCYSLFYSNEPVFSCEFKLLPATIIFCLSISLLMFFILILIQLCQKHADLTQKEYKTVIRAVNIFVLSMAIVLIMIVFFLWFHSPSNLPKSLLFARAVEHSDGSFGPLEFHRDIVNESNIHLFHAGAKSVEYSFNHGPNLFFAAFILLLIILIAFISTKRLTN